MISGSKVHKGDSRVATMSDDLLEALKKRGEKYPRASEAFPDVFFVARDCVCLQYDDATVQEEVAAMLKISATRVLSTEERDILAKECAATIIICRDAYATENRP